MKKPSSLAPFIFLQRVDMLRVLHPLAMFREHRRVWTYAALAKFIDSVGGHRFGNVPLDGEHFAAVPVWALDLTKFIEASYTEADSHGKAPVRTANLVKFLRWVEGRDPRIPDPERWGAVQAVALATMPENCHRLPRETAIIKAAAAARRAMYALAGIRS